MSPLISALISVAFKTLAGALRIETFKRERFRQSIHLASSPPPPPPLAATLRLHTPLTQSQRCPPAHIHTFREDLCVSDISALLFHMFTLKHKSTLTSYISDFSVCTSYVAVAIGCNLRIQGEQDGGQVSKIS